MREGAGARFSFQESRGEGGREGGRGGKERREGRMEKGEGAGTFVHIAISFSFQQSLLCEVTDPEDLPTNQDLTLTVHVGEFSAPAGIIRINTTPELLIILVPVFAGFIILCVVIFIILFAVFCRKTRQKDQRYDQLMMELERLESSVARECKLGMCVCVGEGGREGGREGREERGGWRERGREREREGGKVKEDMYV